MIDSAINLNSIKRCLRELIKQVERRAVRHPLLPEADPGAETIAFTLIQGIVQAYENAAKANDMGAVIMITDELSRSSVPLGDAIPAMTTTWRSREVRIFGAGLT